MIILLVKISFEAIEMRCILSALKTYKVKIEAANELNVAETPSLSRI